MSTSLHRCRFLSSSSSHITAMAFNYTSLGVEDAVPSDLLLAVGRSNGNLEIWNPGQNWSLNCIIPGSRERSIESICWSSDHSRIYTVGATEKITEWDLESMQAINHYDAFAGIIWAIEASPDGKLLAAVTEVGVISVFSLPDMEFVKRLPSADTSLACVTWLSNTRLVAGGADARLRVWDVPSSRIVATMKVDRGKGVEKTLVWKVLRLSDSQFVSGDSNGFIKFWDTKTFSLHQSFEAHPGDVLCLAADSQGSLFSSGLDQKIVWLKMTDKKFKRWSIMSSRVAQTQDVRCMVSYEGKDVSYLLSGGHDLVLNSMYKFDQRPARKLVAASPCATVGDLVYTWRDAAVHIWNLKDGGKRKLAEINVGGDEYITACALSVDHEMLFVGTRHSFRAFKLEGLASGKLTNVERLEDLPIRGDDGVAWVAFYGNKLVYVNFDNEVHVCSETRGTEIEADLPTTKSPLPYAQNLKLAQLSGDRLAVVRHNNCIEVYDVKRMRLLDTLPRPSEAVTAIAFRAKTLVVVTVSQNVYEFDLQTSTLSKWSKQYSRALPFNLTQQTSNCQGVFSDPAAANRLWLYGFNWLAYLDLSTSKPYQKRKAQEAELDVEILDGAPNFWITHKYKPLYATAFESGILVSEARGASVTSKRLQF